MFRLDYITDILLFCKYLFVEMKITCSLLFLLLGFFFVEAAVRDKQSHSSTSFIRGLFRRGGDGGLPEEQDGFQILEERLAYSGWRTIIKRKVRMRNGKIVDFDVSQMSRSLKQRHEEFQLLRLTGFFSFLPRTSWSASRKVVAEFLSLPGIHEPRQQLCFASICQGQTRFFGA